MTIETLGIVGPVLLQTSAHTDERGFFSERFRDDIWKDFLPGHPGFVQENYSWSKPGVIRGLHFQHTPSQGKLVCCVEGSIADVVVDIRRDSPTLGQHLIIELHARQLKWLWIPAGFAHGFAVIGDVGAGVLYKVDGYYNPGGEGSILWNDPALKIAWPLQNPLVSAKDAAAPNFQEYLTSRLFSN